MPRLFHGVDRSEDGRGGDRPRRHRAAAGLRLAAAAAVPRRRRFGRDRSAALILIGSWKWRTQPTWWASEVL